MINTMYLSYLSIVSAVWSAGSIEVTVSLRTSVIWYSPASFKISIWNSFKKEREHYHNYFISILYLYEEAFSWELISGLIFMLILFPEDGSFPHIIQVGPIYIR